MSEPTPRDNGAGSRAALVVVGGVTTVLIAANLAGLPYFLLSAAERVRSPMHPWFRSTGIVGQSAGIAAFLLFAFLWLYPLRKRFHRLAFTGSLAGWLDAHVLAALCIPLLAALHAGWRFSGLIGLGFGAMMIAWMSGIVGRYLYVRIPRSRSGVELTRGEVEAQRRTLLHEIAGATGVEPELLEHVLVAGTSPTIPADINPLRAFGVMIADDIRRRRAERQLLWGWHGASEAELRVSRESRTALRRLMRREIQLAQQMRMLDTTQRLFRYWHVAHKPMAIVALGAVVAHVATAILLGVTWFH